MVVPCTTATGLASTDKLRVYSFQEEAVPKSFASKVVRHRWEDARRGVLLPLFENGYDEISPNLHEGVFRVRCTVSIGLFTF